MQLILKLASVYKVEPEELQAGAGGSIAALREVFADPLLSDELPGEQELVEIAEAAPNVSAAVVKLASYTVPLAEAACEATDTCAAARSVWALLDGRLDDRAFIGGEHGSGLGGLGMLATALASAAVVGAVALRRAKKAASL